MVCQCPLRVLVCGALAVPVEGFASLGELLFTVSAVLIVCVSTCAEGRRWAFKNTVWIAWHLLRVLNLHPGCQD